MTAAERRTASPEALAVVAAVEQRLGLRLQRGLHDALLNAAHELLAERRVSTLEELAARVAGAREDDPLVLKMTRAAAVGETYFFRNPEQLQLLRELVLTHLAPQRARTGARTLRLWSAACASGEEAYTLAMMFWPHVPGLRVQVVGTDMNPDALRAARAATYGPRAFRGAPQPEYAWALEPAPGGARRPVEELRQAATFFPLNLVTDSLAAKLPGQPFDVVLLRNVLIYFAPERVRATVEKVIERLAPGGFLVVTPAEYPLVAKTPGLRLLAKGILAKEHARRPVPPTPIKTPAVARTAPVPAGAAVAVAAPKVAADVYLGLCHAAREAADRGSFHAALELAHEAVRAEPDRPLAHYLAGVVHAARGELEPARQDLQKALFLDRRFAAAELGLGEVLGRQRHDATARRHFQRALKLLADLPDTTMVEGLEVEVRVARSVASAGASGELPRRRG